MSLHLRYKIGLGALQISKMKYQIVLVLTIQLVSIMLGDPWISSHRRIDSFENSRRIKNGTYAKHAIPYQVAIFIESIGCLGERRCTTHKDIKRCSGALINPKVILTAAHCIKGYKDFQILFGTTDAMDQRLKPRLTRTIQSAYYHPEFNSTSLLNDIGVLVTRNDIIVGNVTSIDLLDYDLPEGTPLNISGWGGTEELIRSRYLKVATVKVSNHDECVKSYKGDIVSNNSLCITGVNGYNCQGDSGGPVTFLSSEGPKLVGVMSGGNANCDPTIPSTVTKVNSYLKWIQSFNSSLEN